MTNGNGELAIMMGERIVEERIVEERIVVRRRRRDKTMGIMR
tara:strand:- start:406 stop:531 length:126 start_codon:yes stop_codon:yes gene_type:complete